MIVNDFSVKYWFLQIIITAALDIVWGFFGGEKSPIQGLQILNQLNNHQNKWKFSL